MHFKCFDLFESMYCSNFCLAGFAVGDLDWVILLSKHAHRVKTFQNSCGGSTLRIVYGQHACYWFLSVAFRMYHLALLCFIFNPPTLLSLFLTTSHFCIIRKFFQFQENKKKYLSICDFYAKDLENEIEMK